MQARRTIRSAARPAFSLIEMLIVVAIIALLAAVLVPSLQQARRAAQATTCGSRLHQIGAAMEIYASNFAERLPPVYLPDGVTDLYWWHMLMRQGMASGEFSPVGSSVICPADPEPYQPLAWQPGHEHIANASYGMNPWVSFTDGGDLQPPNGIDDLFGPAHRWPRRSEFDHPTDLLLVGEVWHGGVLEFNLPNSTDVTIQPMWNEWEWPRHAIGHDEAQGRVQVLFADGHAKPAQRYVDIAGFAEGDFARAARMFQP